MIGILYAYIKSNGSSLQNISTAATVCSPDHGNFAVSFTTRVVQQSMLMPWKFLRMSQQSARDRLYPDKTSHCVAVGCLLFGLFRVLV